MASKNKPMRAQERPRPAAATSPAANSTGSSDDKAQISSLIQQATMAHRAGKPERVRELLERVIDIAPDHAHSLYNLAVLYRDAGELLPAERTFRRAIKSDPELIDAYQGLGDLLQSIKHLIPAATVYEEGLRRAPNRVPLLRGLAYVRLVMKHAPVVEGLARRIIAIDDRVQETWWQLAWSLLRQRRGTDEILQCLDRGEALGSTTCLSLALRHVTADVAGQSELAAALWQQVLQKARADETAFRQACEAYIWSDRMDLSRQVSLAFFEAHPENTMGLKQLSYAIMGEGDFEGANRFLDRAIEIAPDDRALKLVKSLNTFRLGNYRDGWELYRYRWGRDQVDKPWDIPAPDWDGKDLGQSQLAVFSEQGIGDQAMFAVLFSELRSLARSVTVETSVRMVSLMHRSFPDMRCVHRDSLPANFDPSRIAAKAPIGDLPLLLGADMENLPNRGGFLTPEPMLTRKLRDRYQRLFPGKRLVGISWRSGNRDTAALRSVDLELMAPVLSTPNCAFISLQYGEVQRDLEDLARQTGHRIHWDPEVDPLSHMDPFAAQVAAMDLVVSVDNSTVHFAGALGVPCWVMLPVASDWRWLTERSTSIWYDSLMLFRQRLGQGWQPLIREIADRLAALPMESNGSALAEICLRGGSDLMRFGRWSEAEDFFRWLIEQNRHLDVALHGIGRVALRHGHAGDAAGILGRAMELAPGRRDIAADYAVALNAAGYPADAERLARQLVRSDGADRASLIAMGHVLAGRGRPDEATDYFAQVLRTEPGDARTRLSLSRLQGAQGEWELAKRNLTRALEDDPALAEAHALLGEIHLRQTGAQEGWSHFGWRFGDRPGELPRHLAMITPDDRPQPVADCKLRRKRLYLRAERSLTEQVLFAGCLAGVACDSRSVLLECDPRLAALLSRSAPKVDIRAAGSLAPRDLVAARVQVSSSLGDLASIYAADRAPGAWLTPDASAVATARERFRSLLPGRRLLGLAWSHKEARAPDGLTVAGIAMLLQMEGWGVVALQRGETAAILDQACTISGQAAVDGAAGGDLDVLAANVAALDAVLSVDGLIGVLSAALAKRTIKLASPAEHWCWGTPDQPGRWFAGVEILHEPSGEMNALLPRAMEQLARWWAH